MLLGDCGRPLALASASEDRGAVLAWGGAWRRRRRQPGPGVGYKHRDRCQLGRSPGSEPAQKTWSQAAYHVGRPSLDSVLGSLTTTERAVEQLAVDGRTDKEIADKLFISPHTVHTHLRHLYEKLGVKSRWALSKALQ